MDWSILAFSQSVLFEVASYSSPRAFHECKTHQQSALRWLRSQDLPKVAYEQQHVGTRLAPVIDKLRNGWGFEILGDGSIKKPYTMPFREQYPTKVEVTETMQAAYYASSHWHTARRKRLELDKYSCVMCEQVGPASVVHHAKYELFNESTDELISLCDRHHTMIHENSRIGFPIGVDVSIAEKLLEVSSYSFEDWLLPLGAAS